MKRITEFCSEQGIAINSPQIKEVCPVSFPLVVEPSPRRPPVQKTGRSRFGWLGWIGVSIGVALIILFPMRGKKFISKYD
jgi:hypothetical protein